MIIIVSIIFTIIFSIAQVFLINLYFNNFTQRNIKKYSFIIISFILLCLIKLLPTNTEVIFKTGVFILILTIIIFISYKGTIIERIYHIIFFSLILILSDLCLTIFISNINIYLNQSYMFALVVSFIVNSLSLLLSFIIIKLLIYFKNEVTLELNTSEYILLGIIPFCSLICIFIINDLQYLNQITCYIYLLTINVCIMFLYYKILKKNILSQKYLIIKKENEYYQSCLTNQKEVMQVKHDLKNMMLNIDYLLAENKVDETRHIITKLMNEEIEKYEKISGCVPIDAILNSKLNICKREQIAYQIDIKIPYNLDIELIDIAVILGNLLDNAIEATIKIKAQKERHIFIVIKYLNDKLVIKIKNTCNEITLNLSDNLLTSNKIEGRYGIGINSIRHRIDKIEGYEDFSYKNGWFTALIIFPLK